MKKILVGIFCTILLLLLSCTTTRIHRMGKQYVTIYHIFPSPDKIGLDYARVYLVDDTLCTKPYFIYVPSRFNYEIGNTLLYNFEYYDFLTK